MDFNAIPIRLRLGCVDLLRDAHRDFLGWLRRGCRWLQIVEPIDGRAVAAVHQMPIHIDGRAGMRYVNITASTR